MKFKYFLTTGFVLFLLSILFGQTKIGNTILGKVEEDLFGRSVSLSENGNIIAIGATHHEDEGVDRGQVCVYNLENNEWVQLGQCINGEMDEDYLGFVVELSADGLTLLVSSIGTSEIKSYVKVFEFIDGFWNQKGSTLFSSEENDVWGFGADISSDGNTVIIGAHRNSLNGNLAGKIQVFEYENETWNQLGQTFLGVSDGGLDYLGWAVAIANDSKTIAFTARSAPGLIGRLEVHRLVGDMWEQIGESNYGDGLARFGNSISISKDGNLVVVGIRDEDGNRGAIRTYKLENGQYVVSGDDIMGDNINGFLSWDIALSSDGSKLITSIPRYSLTDNSQEGAVRVYKNIDGLWVQESEIIGESEQEGLIGVSISNNGEFYAIGSIRSDESALNAGTAKVYTNDPINSIEIIGEKQLKIFPNPVQSSVRILNEITSESKFVIFNVKGKVVLEGKLSSEIKLGEIPIGLYFIKVFSDTEEYNGSFMRVN